MVVDGSEMSRYGLPYFCQSDKSSSEGVMREMNFLLWVHPRSWNFQIQHSFIAAASGWKIATRLYGGIIHGHFAGAFMYPAHLTGGSNVTCEVIYRWAKWAQCLTVCTPSEYVFILKFGHRMLTTFILGDQSAGIPPSRLPPVLYLQLDNTAKCVLQPVIFGSE